MRIPRRYAFDKPFINVTPLVDVMLFLLIFFLASTQLQKEERDIQVSLPETKVNETLSNGAQTLLVINIRRDGSYVLNGHGTTADALREVIRRAVASNPDQKVLVRGDKQALHGYVAAAVSLCREVGIRHTNIGYDLPH